MPVLRRGATTAIPEEPDYPWIVEGLRHLAVPVADLKLDPKNTRRHGQRNLDAVEASLRRFGQYLPIVVQRQGMIVRVGNGRTTLFRDRLQWSHIAALVVDESDVEAVARSIMDNRTAELAEWDEVNLRDVVADFDAASVGFTEKDLSSIFGTTPSLKDRAAALGDMVYRVIIECTDSEHQQKLLERFEKEGLECRPVVS